MRAVICVLVLLAGCDELYDCHEVDLTNHDVEAVDFVVTVGLLDQARTWTVRVQPGEKISTDFTRDEDARIVDECRADPIVQDPHRGGDLHFEVDVHSLDGEVLSQGWTWTTDASSDYVSVNLTWDGANLDWTPDED